MTGTVLILGALAGGGLAVAGSALVPARPTLAQALAALRTAPVVVGGVGPWRVRVLSAPLRALGLPRAGMRTDLAVLDLPVAQHLADQMLAILAGVLLLPVATALLSSTGASFGSLPAWAAIGGGLGGWWLAESTVHGEAQRRRAELRYALSAVLDLTVISLAGGAGLEQALDDACADTHGWAAARLHRAVATARLRRVPPWQVLGELGTDTDVTELAELAATMSLAGTEGARIRTSLAVRAATLRAHAVSDLEAKANSATARMSMPVMALAVAFLAFLLYPALASLTGL
jgi:tight adherence protein C